MPGATKNGLLDVSPKAYLSPYSMHGAFFAKKHPETRETSCSRALCNTISSSAKPRVGAIHFRMHLTSRWNFKRAKFKSSFVSKAYSTSVPKDAVADILGVRGYSSASKSSLSSSSSALPSPKILHHVKCILIAMGESGKALITVSGTNGYAKKCAKPTLGTSSKRPISLRIEPPRFIGTAEGALELGHLLVDLHSCLPPSNANRPGWAMPQQRAQISTWQHWYHLRSIARCLLALGRNHPKWPGLKRTTTPKATNLSIQRAPEPHSLPPRIDVTSHVQPSYI